MQLIVNKRVMFNYMVASILFCVILLNDTIVNGVTQTVVIETSMGDMTVELDRDAAPVSVANFMTYVDAAFYDGLIFHRVDNVTNVIQGGGFDQNFVSQPTNDPIVNESDNGLSNLRGTIAMARTADLNSATSQFYINTVDNLGLDPVTIGANDGYAVFGQVVNGFDVLDLITTVATESVGGLHNVPSENVIIKRIYDPTVMPFSAQIISSTPLTVVEFESDKTFQFSVKGKGLVSIEGTKDVASGKVIAIADMSIANTSSKSTVSVIAEVEGDTLKIENLTLSSNIKLLELECDIQHIATGVGDKTRTIKTLNLATLVNISTPKFLYLKMNIGALGDPSALEMGDLDVKHISELYVVGDIYNTQLLKEGSKNSWKRIYVGGVVHNGIFYGRKLKSFIIENDKNELYAMAQSHILLGNNKGELGLFSVVTGSVFMSNIIAGKVIKKIELLNGLLAGDSGNVGGNVIRAASSKGEIKEIAILRDSTVTDDPNIGLVAAMTIYAGHKLGRLHFDGDVHNSVTISTNTTNSPLISNEIDYISSGGNFSGTVSALHINKIKIGYDYKGRRISEPKNGEYTGAHMQFASIEALYMSIKEINVTGEIRNTVIQSFYGRIKNIFVEDGIFDSHFVSTDKIKNIMIGYRDGSRRHKLVNKDAGMQNVTLSVKKLGRLFYTGKLDKASKKSVKNAHPIFVYDEVK